MEVGLINDGYYKVYEKNWFESSDSKTGWESYGWGEDDGFEIVQYLESDKYGNPTKALFKYNGAVFLGSQHAAYNIQVNFLHQFMEIMRKIPKDQTFDQVKESNPRIGKLLTVIDMLEESYEIKNYLGI